MKDWINEKGKGRPLFQKISFLNKGNSSAAVSNPSHRKHHQLKL
jgi:hypothetical protein